MKYAKKEMKRETKVSEEKSEESNMKYATKKTEKGK